ncbi:MarR family transcriptional regulator [Rathayibacter caricis]|uniref:MarR family winged helix-turn-helix transcriptional regulator n=1 Tax=Rathayibacter caricis TaxID=110936 RepID=UPI001FB49B6A|nr:MarR family transcriptional regulator [Rathayibacter caricis]MCJ1697755.1 MarR family transcriptional regulator [Rathayibacter caricis]
MGSPNWLSTEERETWVRFSAVLELLPAALDSQLTQDAGLTHFDYFALAMLSEAPDRVLRASALAARTNSTLPRLSKVINRLESRGLVRRYPCPEDRRATNIALTESGWQKVVETAPGHLANVRAMVVDALTPEQMRQLSSISAALLTRLDPAGKMLASDRQAE